MKSALRTHKSVFPFIFVLFVLLVVAIVYVKMNPPLYVSAVTYDESDNGYRVVHLINKGINGIGSVSLRKFFVNEGESPTKVELGVSRSFASVAYEEDPNVSYHKINEYKIQPWISPEDKKKETYNTDHIFNYGIRVFHEIPVQSITIKYTFFRIPFKLTEDVRLQ